MTPMTLEVIRDVLGWCAILNLVLLLYWFVMIAFARGWVYRMHSRWYPVSEERFGAIHYQGMMYFKIAVFFFNVVPYLALRIVG